MELLLPVVWFAGSNYELGSDLSLGGHRRIHRKVLD